MLAGCTARPVPLPCQERCLHQDPHSYALHQTVGGTCPRAAIAGQLMTYGGHVLALKDQQMDRRPLWGLNETCWWAIMSRWPSAGKVGTQSVSQGRRGSGCAGSGQGCQASLGSNAMQPRGPGGSLNALSWAGWESRSSRPAERTWAPPWALDQQLWQTEVRGRGPFPLWSQLSSSSR